VCHLEGDLDAIGQPARGQQGAEASPGDEVLDAIAGKEELRER
jgi:hypothetical protein